MEQEIKYAEETDQYRDMMILHLDAATILYRDLLESNVDTKFLLNDNGLFNKTLSELLVIMDHLLPKLEGSGESTKVLVEKFKPFKKWKKDPVSVKKNNVERLKIHDLFSLILMAYEKLGFTRI